VYLLHSVNRNDTDNRGACLLGFQNYLLDGFAGDERPDGVMHRHQIRFVIDRG
jgi:hypothetical protein